MTDRNVVKSHALISGYPGRYKLVTSGDRWRCIRCGTCCRAQFEDGWINFAAVLVDDEFPAGRCEHLTVDNKIHGCNIYRVRPNACRAFPFTLRKREDGKYRLMIHSKCRGLGHGRVLDIRARIKLIVRCANRELKKRMRLDFMNFDEDEGVGLIK